MAKRITPNATPIRTLAKEMMFSYVRNKVGVKKLTKLMVLAKDKGIIKNAREFRYWLNDELCKTVDIIEKWLEQK